MDSKPFWASRTLWINAIALVAGAMAVVNIVLRLVTDSAVGLSGE